MRDTGQEDQEQQWKRLLTPEKARQLVDKRILPPELRKMVRELPKIPDNEKYDPVVVDGPQSSDEIIEAAQKALENGNKPLPEIKSLFK